MVWVNQLVLKTFLISIHSIQNLSKYLNKWEKNYQVHNKKLSLSKNRNWKKARENLKMSKEKYVTEEEIHSWVTTKILNKLINPLIQRDSYTQETWEELTKMVYFTLPEELKSLLLQQEVKIFLLCWLNSK